MIKDPYNSYIKYTYHVYDNNGIFLVSCVGLEPLYEVIGISEQEYYTLDYDFNTQAKFSWFNYRVFPEINKTLTQQIKDGEIKSVRTRKGELSETTYYKIK